MIRIGLAATMLIPAPLHADSERDHDQGRRAVERGEALPLTDILARVRLGLGGEVVGVSFERKRGRWVHGGRDAHVASSERRRQLHGALEDEQRGAGRPGYNVLVDLAIGESVRRKVERAVP